MKLSQRSDLGVLVGLYYPEAPEVPAVQSNPVGRSALVVLLRWYQKSRPVPVVLAVHRSLAVQLRPKCPLIRWSRSFLKFPSFHLFLKCRKFLNFR